MQENNSSPQHPHETINLDFVLKEVGNDPEFIVDLLETFSSALSDHINRLTEMIKSRETLDLFGTVHKLKPSLKMFNLTSSLDHVFTIESEIHHQLPSDDLLKIVSALTEKLTSAKTQVESLVMEYQDRK